MLIYSIYITAVKNNRFFFLLIVVPFFFYFVVFFVSFGHVFRQIPGNTKLNWKSTWEKAFKNAT